VGWADVSWIGHWELEDGVSAKSPDKSSLLWDYCRAILDNAISLNTIAGVTMAMLL
jgi:hypothetical protein